MMIKQRQKDQHHTCDIAAVHSPPPRNTQTQEQCHSGQQQATRLAPKVHFMHRQLTFAFNGRPKGKTFPTADSRIKTDLLSRSTVAAAVVPPFLNNTFSDL